MNNERSTLWNSVSRVVRSPFFLIVVGAITALILAPQTRRRSRTWLRQGSEMISSRFRRGKREASRWQSYERGKARGMLYDLRSRLGRQQELSEKVDDDIITDRVRTKLGEHRRTWHLPRLNVDTFDGVVTVRGHLSSEIDVHAVESVCRSVPGVREVVSKMTFNQGEEKAASASS